jgi:hypothetical protein
MAGVQQLGLELGEIHVGRTLGAARLARQTVTQGLVQLSRSQRATFEAPLQRRPDRVGATSGGLNLIADGDEGGTHGGRLLEAPAAAVALLQVAHERSIPIDEAELRHEGQHQIGADTEAQVSIDLEATLIDDLAGIHHPFGIEQILDLVIRGHQLRSEVIRDVLGTRDPDPVLGRERSPKP